MFNNYFKIVLRNIRRYKTFSLINIFGLSIGIAATILILLFVQHELSYDSYHKDSDRIYRLSRKFLNNDGSVNLNLGHVAPPFGPLIANDFEGDVQHVVRLISGYGPVMKYEDKTIQENRFFFADPDVFQVFSWEFIKGNPETALTEPNSIVLTETTAAKYFGDEEPLGKSLNFNNFNLTREYEVTGVVRDIPLNSHFKWDMIASFEVAEEFYGGREAMMSNFGGNNFSTFILFRENYDVSEFEARIPAFIDKHLGTNHNGRPASKGTTLELMPLTDIHLHSHLDSEIEANGDIKYVYIFTIIAILILIIACINFINLSTARAAKRAKEVGLRKVMGAFRTSLIKQFILESLTFTLAGLLLALIIIAVFLPYFNDFTQKDLSLNVFDNEFLLLITFGIVIFVGFLAGSYPAFYLSSFEPAAILKKEYKSLRGRFDLRSFLVVLQFAISTMLIISVGILNDQLDFMRSKDPGFNKNNMLSLPTSSKIFNEWEDVEQRLVNNPNIISASISSRVPSGRLLDSQAGQYELEGDIKPITFRIADVHVDHDFLQNYKIPLIAGRYFDKNRASDSTKAMILNRIAIVQLGYSSPEEAIGQRFDYGGRQGEIIGVVENIHWESLHQSIAPVVFLVTSGRNSRVSVRYAEGKKDEALAYLNEQWKYYRSDYPFTATEISEQYDLQYSNEDRLQTVIKSFSILAVIIAALGLYGLSMFLTEIRIREVGIRKTLGAEVGQIISLLGKGFTILVGIAFLISVPAVYFFMDSWLDNFAYRITIDLMPFVVGMAITILIAWATISYQIIKAALISPAEVMKYE